MLLLLPINYRIFYLSSFAYLSYSITLSKQSQLCFSYSTPIFFSHLSRFALVTDHFQSSPLNFVTCIMCTPLCVFIMCTIRHLSYKKKVVAFKEYFSDTKAVSLYNLYSSYAHDLFFFLSDLCIRQYNEASITTHLFLWNSFK